MEYIDIVKNASREIETAVNLGEPIEAAKWAVYIVAKMESLCAEPIDAHKLWNDAKNYYFRSKY